MSETNQEKQTVLKRLINRESIITKEMNTLATKGYIDKYTADRAIRGYQSYTQDQLSELNNSEPVKKQPTIPKVTKTAMATVTLKNGPVEDGIPREKEGPVYKKPKKEAKTAEQLREGHLQIILIAGVALLFLAGAVLATTSWLLLSPITKVSLISLIAIVFLGMAKLASVLKIPQTSKAFLILACLFFPFPFLSGGYYQLFGSYLSIVGPGRFLFGFLLTAAFAGIYGLIGHKKNLGLMTQLSVGLAYISLLFLLRQLIPSHEGRSLIILGVLMAFNEGSSAIYRRFYSILDAKQWELHLALINGISVLVTLTSFKLSIMGIIFLGLLATLCLQIGSQSTRYQLKWWRLSDALITLMFVVGSFVLLFEPWAGLTSILLLIGYTRLRQYWQRVESSTNFDKLQVRYDRKLCCLFILGLGSHLIVNDTLIPGLFGFLSSGLVLITIGRFYKTLTNKRKINLGILSFLLLIELVALLPLETIWQVRGLLLVAILLYNWVIRHQDLNDTLSYLTTIALSSYALLWVIGCLVQPELTMVELSSWNLLIFSSLIHFCLVSSTAKQRLSPLMPVGFVLSLIPVCSQLTELSWSTFLLSLGVLGLGYFLTKWLAPAFMVVSHWLSLALYGSSLVFLLANHLFNHGVWAQLIILLFGCYLMYSCGIWLKQPLFLNGVPLMFFWSLLFLLSLLGLSDFGQLIYYELLLVLSYMLVNYHQQKPFYFLGKIGLTMVLVLFWLLSIGQVAFMSTMTPSFIGLFLPMVLLGAYFIHHPNKWLKRGILLIESYLTIALLQLSLYQLVEISLEYHWQFFILTTLLTAGLFLKKQREIIWPVGLLQVAFTLLLFLGASYGQLIEDWSLIGGSVVLLAHGMTYLVLSRVSQVTQLGILVTLVYDLCLFPSRENVSSLLFSVIVWALLIASAGLSLWKRQPLLMAKNRPNLMMFVQLIGLAGLLVIGIDFLWVKLYLLVLTFALSLLETTVVKRSLLTLTAITSFSLVNDGLSTYLEPINGPLRQLLTSFSILIALTVTFRFIWQKPQLAKPAEWVVSGLILLSYLAISIGGNLTNGLYGAIFALLLVVIAYLTKYTAYFTNGLIYLVVFILYSQRHFWAAIPWWLYLAIGGLLLITLGSLSEWRRRNQSGSLVKAKDKVKDYFKDWQ